MQPHQSSQVHVQVAQRGRNIEDNESNAWRIALVEVNSREAPRPDAGENGSMIAGPKLDQNRDPAVRFKLDVISSAFVRFRRGAASNAIGIMGPTS